MNKSHLKQLHHQIDKLLLEKKLESEHQYFPILEMTPEEKLAWPKNLPFPIYAGRSTIR